MAISDSQLADDLVHVKASKERLATVKIADITFRHDLNPRDRKTAYDPKSKENQPLFNSLKSEGWQEGSRVILHQNTIEINENDNLVMVRGNRRAAMAEAADMKSVPAIILSGLTDRQVYNLMVEMKQVDYGPIGEFKACRDLMVSESLGQKKVAERLGIKENKVQEYRTLAKLPQVIYDAWVGQKRGETDKPFTIGRPQIVGLYAAMERDRKGMTLDSENKQVPSGLGEITDPNGGPEYKKAYEFYLGGGKAKSSVSAETVKVLAETYKEPTLRSALFGISDNSSNRGELLNTVADTCAKYKNLVALKITQPQLSALIESVTTEERSIDAVELDIIKLKHVAAWVSEACAFKIEMEPDNNPLVELPSKETPSYEGALPPEEVVTEAVVPDSPETVVTEPEPEPEPKVTLTKTKKQLAGKK